MQFLSLNPKALGLTLGMLAGAGWFLLMAFSLTTGAGQLAVSFLGPLHPFFRYDWVGAVIMAVEHFIYGFIAGWIFARLYNALLPGTGA